ncbi:hypothetical protein JCM10213_004373, partial [Rhodosporidiobolus nylandii]
SKRNLLGLNLDLDLLNPQKGLLGLDLNGDVLKNPHNGKSLVDLDTSLGVLSGGKLVDSHTAATVGSNGKGSSLVDLDADATVGGSSLVSADVNADVLKNGKTGSAASKRNLLGLNLDLDLLNPQKGLLGLDLNGDVLKNPHNGKSLVDLDTSLDLLSGGKLVDSHTDATVGSNGKGSSLVDLNADATVGGPSLVSADVDADVLKNGKTGQSLVGADVDATVLSAKKGLLDATATVKSGSTDLANLNVLSGKNALIDLDITGAVLGSTCTGNAVLGVQAEVSLLNILHLCVCLDVISLGGPLGGTPCPKCPANSEPICGSGQCGCKCQAGFFADPVHGCLPIRTCTSTGGFLQRNTDGTSSCECPSPYVASSSGGCSLPPSARARRSDRQKKERRLNLSSRAEHAASSLEERDAARCPAGERACPIGSLGGWECMDVSNELESCGGCPGEPSSVNCLTLPGVENVGCAENQCIVSSCRPGFRLLNGRCISTSRR